MFRGGTPRQKRQQRNHVDTKSFETPLDELTFRLDRMEELTEKIRTSWHDVEQNGVSSTSLGKKDQPRGLFRGRRKVNSPKQSDLGEKTDIINNHWTQETKARFVTLVPDEEEEMVELLRRTAELVIMGEKAGAAAQTKADALRLSAVSTAKEDDESNAVIESHIALFENFFERNALGLIVKIVTGERFKDGNFLANSTEISLAGGDEGTNDAMSSSEHGAETDTTECIGSVEKTGSKFDGTLLPPIQVAIQAIQSVCILIQNVSRATSLYFLLSNNYVNDLINLPLEQYAIAERFKCGDISNTPMNRRKAGSQEMAELTTHYVTFLKSLALRMNAETLQFFLTYPDDPTFLLIPPTTLNSEKSSSNTDYTVSPIGKPVQVKAAQVEFPLYARSLEYCASHQDRFVRVTAMNICLNTLRLTTMSTTESSEVNFDENAKSPDGSLCTALPLRERLAIAQHVCAPSRVEALISPIFTNLAKLWGVVEEQIREIDLLRAGILMNVEGARIRDSKMEKAKAETKKRRLTDGLRDSLANLQDELLLLEDVFRVGLTSLNEQTIEMMLATFVYPLLLQPLLLYMQRFKNPANASQQTTSMADVLTLGAQTGFAEAGADERDADRIQEAAPAKTALFTMTAVFQSLSNQPLMRLLLTSLFHPLSPDSSFETMIRAKPDVAGVDPDGNLLVRVDPRVSDDGGLIKFEKSPYSFGNVTGTKSYKGENPRGDDSEESCVYVLSPALSEVLEGKAGDLSLIAKTRTNPYRRAVLRCLAAGPSMSGLRQISVLLMDSVVNRFDHKFTSDILFGVGMKTLTEEIPLDERNSDSRRAFTKNNRDMGERNESASRHTMKSGGDVNFMSEVVTSLCLSLINVSTHHEGLWKLVFDGVASHALLSLAKENPSSLQLASKIMENRRRLACTFVADAPLLVDLAIGAPDEKDDSYEEEDIRVGLHSHSMVFANAKGKQFSVVGELLKLKDAVGRTETDEYSVSVAVASKLDDLTLRICNFGQLQLADEDVKDAVQQLAATSAMALVQVDALSTFLKDLAATNGAALKDAPSAFTISRAGILTSTTLASGADVNRSFFCSISPRMAIHLLKLDDDVSDKEMPEVGSVVGLVNRTAIPCVCEVPASCTDLLNDNTVSIISDGVKWLSLYLVFLGQYMVLAEPERQGSGGNGRIITAAHLTRLDCERDVLPQLGNSSPARRLLISHRSLDNRAPGLFLAEKQTVQIPFGPFNRLSMHTSTLDVWFEDDSAAEHAMGVLKFKLSRALAKRGNRLRERLAKDL